MSPNTYKKRLAHFELSQVDAGILLGFSARTGQRWAAEGPPTAIAIVFRQAKDRAELDRMIKQAERP